MFCFLLLKLQYSWMAVFGMAVRNVDTFLGEIPGFGKPKSSLISGEIELKQRPCGEWGLMSFVIGNTN